MRDKTKQAVELVNQGKETVYMAAKKVGVNRSTVGRAMKQERCPTCGKGIHHKKS